MQRLYLLIAVLLLSGTWVAAQSGQSTSGQSGSSSAQSTSGQSSSSSGNETSMEGCVTGTVDQLILTDVSGNSYQLSGDSDLGKHLGHQVRVTGTQSPSTSTSTGGTPSTPSGTAPSGTTPSATAPSGAGGGQPVFKVTRVTMISDTCKQPKQ